MRIINVRYLHITTETKISWYWVVYRMFINPAELHVPSRHGNYILQFAAQWNSFQHRALLFIQVTIIILYMYTFLVTQYLAYGIYDMTIDECWIGKDLKIRVLDLIEILFL
jgi:hypothetical protein